MDEFYSTGRGPIVNLNLEESINQLISRASTYIREQKDKDKNSKDSKDSKKDKGAAKAAVSGSKDKKSSSLKDNKKKKDDKKEKDHHPDGPCKICGKYYAGRYYFDCPNEAPDWWKKKNQWLLNKIGSPTLSAPSSPNPDAIGKEMTIFGQAKAVIKAVVNLTQQIAADNDWFIDSCASYYICPDIYAFSDYKAIPESQLKKEDFVVNIYGNLTHPLGSGTVIILISYGSLALKDVRYNPKFNSNLILVGKLVRDDNKLAYTDNY